MKVSAPGIGLCSHVFQPCGVPAGILSIPLFLFFTFCLTGSNAVTSLLYDAKSGLDFNELCTMVRFVLLFFVVRDLLEAGCHLIGGALTATLDTRALFVVRLVANAVWIVLIGGAFLLRPSLGVYAGLTPIQMVLVLVPLLIRRHRRVPDVHRS